MLRDLVRALLTPTFDVVDGERWGSGAWPRPAAVVARVEVGARHEAAAVARSAGGDVPVVVLSPDARWAGRFVSGTLTREAEELTPDEMRDLMTG